MDKFSKYYDILISENINKITKSFIKYFGNQYCDIIENKIKSIIFIWYKHNLINTFYSSYRTSDKIKEDLEILLKYKNNEFIGSTKNIDEYKNILKKLIDDNNNILASNINIYKHNVVRSFVLFPIIMCNDKNLIHEIEHSVVYNMIKNGENNISFKSGLFLGKLEDKLFEELINERSAIDIFNLFHNMGGNILERDIHINLCNAYDNYLPLVEKFYIKYIDLLKIVRISSDYNLLFDYIDRDIYNEYVKYVYQIYNKNEDKLSNYKFKTNDKYILTANKFVDMMELGENKQLKLVKD